MGFTTPSYDLIDLFARVDRGDLQLPDFQRSYSWDVDRIRALLVTVLRGYPMGSFMALDTRNEPMRFRPRPLEGAPDLGVDPGLLLLDGQQRLTTLYHSLRGDGHVDTVDFRNKRIRRHFYVDIAKATSAEVMPDEAVFSVDEQGRITWGLADRISSTEEALAAGAVPVSALLSDAGTDMLFDYAEGADPATKARAKEFNNHIAKPLVRYQIPVTRLDRETAQWGVGSIFAQANSAGLQMGVFELLTAVFANEDPNFQLREDWHLTKRELRRYPVLTGIDRTRFLSGVALYASARAGHASGLREDILRLDLATYIPAAKKMRAAFVEAARFLQHRRILDAGQVPYMAQIVPLAVILGLLADTPEVWDAQPARDRLNQWFWCGIFGELYGAPNVDNRCSRDVAEVTEWIREAARHPEEAELGKDQREPSGQEANTGAIDAAGDAAAGEPAVTETPSTVSNAYFNESRLLSVDENSGVYKGISALIMGRGALDWRTALPFNAETFHQLSAEFRPIFPLVWCEDNQIPEVLAESVLNRTPMGRRTDVVLGDMSPARYLPRVQSKSLLDNDEFDDVLSTHLLDPELLHAAKAEEFFADRRGRLLGMVEEAMGKPAVHDVDESDLRGGAEGPNAFVAPPSE